jgi:hypothetical protein
MTMALNRIDTRPCEVGTADYDWGNYCPRDQMGVHHCVLGFEHQLGEVRDVDAAGRMSTCRCICGTRRPLAQAKRTTH